MAITRQTIEYIAALARLDPNAGNFEELAEDMQGIIAMVDQLQELDLGNITDTIDTERKNAFRDDVETVSYSSEEVLSNAPVVECGGVSVPRVVE